MSDLTDRRFRQTRQKTPQSRLYIGSVAQWVVERRERTLNIQVNVSLKMFG